MRRNSPVPAGPAELDQVIRLVKSAADYAVITGSFPTHSDEIRTAVTEAFRCALANGLIEIVPADRWPESVWLTPPYTLGLPVAPGPGGAR